MKENLFNWILMKRFTLLFALHFCIISLSAQILVIPDIHGRSFWKEATTKYPEMPVVFLGDYLDPYNDENITSEDALANFKEIIQFKKDYNDRVTLLLGNHEIHYLDMFYSFSRKDTVNAKVIQKMLYDNLHLFCIASNIEMGEKTFLFTHAGVLKKWWMKYFPITTPINAVSMCNALNRNMKDRQTLGTFIDNALMEISILRGGDAEAGSCLWADVEEHRKNEGFPIGIYQIFGHSQQESKPIIRNKYADLDCRKPFIITKNGKVHKAK